MVLSKSEAQTKVSHKNCDACLVSTNNDGRKRELGERERDLYWDLRKTEGSRYGLTELQLLQRVIKPPLVFTK